MIKEAFMKGLMKRIAKKGISSLPPAAIKDLKQQAGKAGPDSFLMWLPTMAAKKAFGEKKVNEALWKIQGKALSADMLAGHIPDKIMSKMPIGKTLFKQEELYKTRGNSYKKVNRSSILAPFAKITDIAKPIVFGMATEKAVRDLKKNREVNKNAE